MKEGKTKKERKYILEFISELKLNAEKLAQTCCEVEARLLLL
jgi:hypothetical protein